METLSVFLRFTKEEIRGLLNVLNHDAAYLPFSLDSYAAIQKLQKAYDNFNEKEGKDE